MSESNRTSTKVILNREEVTELFNSVHRKVLNYLQKHCYSENLQFEIDKIFNEEVIDMFTNSENNSDL